MKSWQIWTSASLVAYGLMSVAMKQAGARLGWKLSLLIGMGLEAVLVGALALALHLYRPGSEQLQSRATSGYLWAMAIGLTSFIGFAGFMLACREAPVGVVQALVSTGTLVVVIAIAGAFLGERLTVEQWAGVALGLASIALLTFGGKP